MKNFFLVLLHYNFIQTKVKTKIINGSPAPVYKGLEAIECLRFTKHLLSLNVYYRKCHVNFRKYKVLEYKI